MNNVAASQIAAHYEAASVGAASVLQCWPEGVVSLPREFSLP